MDSSQSQSQRQSQSPPPEPSPSELGPSTAPPEDVIKILLATDNHLGFAERDPVRGNDSLRTFEEILQIANEKEVDMILLGGDLFHDSKPTVKTIHGTMNLLRKYCMGDRPCYLEYLSEGTTNFAHQFNTVNYMDPNYNVGIPVFSIHGNHDDPTGDASLASLDLLSVSGLVNYFGRQTQVDDITISPVLLRKGQTMLSLYGLGNVRDERLHRTFLRKKVNLLRPHEFHDDWFNLMVVHQNRVPHGKTNYLPETFLDPFLHLVLWGHEHECLIDPVFNTQQEFYVTQPGSSIATALSEGEAKKKHVAVLKIFKSSFEIDKIPLRTVRPFLMDDLILSDVPGLVANDAKGAHRAITKRIHEMIEQANDEWHETHPDDEGDPPLPLIRLRIEYTGFSTFNPQQFGQQYVAQVANPRDMVMFFRKRKAGVPSRRKDAGEQMTEFDMDGDVIMGEGDEENLQTANVSKHLSKDDAAQVEQLIRQCLGGPNLLTLPEAELSDAIKVFVEKNDNAALGDFVDETGKTIVTEIAQKEDAAAGDDSFFTQTAINIKTQRNQAHGSESSLAYLTSRKSQDTTANDDADDAEDTAPATKKRRTTAAAAKTAKATTTAPASTRGRGKGRATAASTRTTTAATRKRKQVEVIDSSEEDEAQMSDEASEQERDELDSDEEMPPTSKARGGKSAATSRTTRANTRSTAAASSGSASQTPTNGTRRMVQSTLSFAPSQASSASSSVVTATPTSTSQRGLPASFGTGPAARGGRGGRGRGKR
ncbi:Metallo-dependent phosphatase-like protein [Catenaria anguillulae PL171]|uniref:Double-strand break repair protein n=1 Tax=Catenaria anguillulae PL171 TaxID=765915 RepID=A0A1Y2HK15_9FUNG|nr:Metallo-dependent phosphatase-like protein [Catenaria anguillulae PL171]